MANREEMDEDFESIAEEIEATLAATEKLNQKSNHSLRRMHYKRGIVWRKKAGK
jgi:hypothetical protein